MASVVSPYQTSDLHQTRETLRQRTQELLSPYQTSDLHQTRETLRQRTQELLRQSAPVLTVNNSFLKRCVDDLSPEKASSANWWSKAYHNAKIVTVVAYIALAIGVFITAGVLIPSYLPMVGLGALVVAMPVASFAQNLPKWSRTSAQLAEDYRAYQQHHTNLMPTHYCPYRQTHNNLDPNRTVAAVQPEVYYQELQDRGIDWRQIPGLAGGTQYGERIAELKPLFPLMAKARFLDDKFQQQMKIKDDLRAEATQLAAADVVNRQKVYELRNAALFAEDRAMEVKIQAAFVNAVLRKYDFNGDLEDIATLSQLRYQERILGNELGDAAGAQEFLFFKNRSLAPLSYNEVRAMTVAELGQRLAAAMA